MLTNQLPIDDKGHNKVSFKTNKYFMYPNITLFYKNDILK